MKKIITFYEIIDLRAFLTALQQPTDYSRAYFIYRCLPAELFQVTKSIFYRRRCFQFPSNHNDIFLLVLDGWRLKPLYLSIYYYGCNEIYSVKKHGLPIVEKISYIVCPNLDVFGSKIEGTWNGSDTVMLILIFKTN